MRIRKGVTVVSTFFTLTVAVAPVIHDMAYARREEQATHAKA
jgi:hypothetical protein